MIIKNFDNGWGHQYQWKKTETQIVNQMLTECIYDRSKTVVVNSVWYTQDFHQEVMSWLRNNAWDRIVLVAMLDAAIPKPDYYSEFDRPVITMGYYSGPYQIDLFAILLADGLDLSDYGDLLDSSDIDTPFICLNRKPHWHRKKLFTLLQQYDLLDRGVVSMGGEDGKAVRSITESISRIDLAPNSTEGSYGILNDIASLGPSEIWRRCFFNMVTETVWNINTNGFVSEKIYKPILGCRPFVVYDPDGGRQWLQDRGFETFEKDFQEITNCNLADPAESVLFLKDLCGQDQRYLKHKFDGLIPKVKHNRDVFQMYVSNQKKLIARGLIFDT